MQRSCHGASTDRASLRGRLKVHARRLPVALGWRVLAAPRASTCRYRGSLHLHRSRYRALTGRASLHLLHGARWRRTLDSCSSFQLPHASGTQLESACRREQAPAGVPGLCNGAAIELQLVEQALRLLHGARWLQTLDVCLSSAGGTRAESACRHATRHHSASVLPLRRRCQRAPTDRASLAAAPRCKMVAEPRCVWHSDGECLPPRPGICRWFAFAKELPWSSD